MIALLYHSPYNGREATTTHLVLGGNCIKYSSLHFCIHVIVAKRSSWLQHVIGTLLSDGELRVGAQRLPSYSQCVGVLVTKTTSTPPDPTLQTCTNHTFKMK